MSDKDDKVVSLVQPGKDKIKHLGLHLLNNIDHGNISEIDSGEYLLTILDEDGNLHIATNLDDCARVVMHTKFVEHTVMCDAYSPLDPTEAS
jgi:hypothetical protein